MSNRWDVIVVGAGNAAFCAAARYLRELIQFHGTNVVVAKGRRGL